MSTGVDIYFGSTIELNKLEYAVAAAYGIPPEQVFAYYDTSSGDERGRLISVELSEQAGKFPIFASINHKWNERKHYVQLARRIAIESGIACIVAREERGDTRAWHILPSGSVYSVHLEREALEERNEPVVNRTFGEWSDSRLRTLELTNEYETPLYDEGEEV